MKKKCTKCLKKKKLDKFCKSKSCLYGVNSYCKVCDNKKRLDYSRTKIGVISKLYATQKSKSKKRKHTPPEYTRDKFETYLLNSKKFNKLYEKWVKSNYDTNLIPSCDRKDDYKGYSFDNIKITTWGKNNLRGYTDRVDGINNKLNKSVEQYSLDDILINTHYSVASVARELNISNKAIYNCCNGVSKTSGGFKWRYTNG